MPTLCLVADGCAKSALSSEPHGRDRFDGTGGSATAQHRVYNAALSLRLSPYSFFTFRFFEPRAYSRRFHGFSAFPFFRPARLVFFRFFFLVWVVFSLNAFFRVRNFVI